MKDFGAVNMLTFPEIKNVHESIVRRAIKKIKQGK